MQNKINLAGKERIRSSVMKTYFFLCAIIMASYACSISSPYTTQSHNRYNNGREEGERKFERYELAIKIIAAKFTYTKSTFSPHKFH